jgi:hypothetical protein
MKRLKLHEEIICSIAIGIITNFAFAQTVPVKHEWNVILKVVDESNQPIADAKAEVGHFSKSQSALIVSLTEAERKSEFHNEIAGADTQRFCKYSSSAGGELASRKRTNQFRTRKMGARYEIQQRAEAPGGRFPAKMKPGN